MEIFSIFGIFGYKEVHIYGEYEQRLN